MDRRTVFTKGRLSPKEIEESGRETARTDEYPCYIVPNPFAHSREMHDAWLRGYSATAANRWPKECVAVR